MGPAALLLFATLARAGATEVLCVSLDTAANRNSYAVAPADMLQVAFAHSIYGSWVEERFQINAAGFKALDIRYSEPRLAEFYGYEATTREDSWWVARPMSREFQTLALRASRDSYIRITIGNHTVSLNDGAARVALGPCARAIHG
jgi:hypothetical protein